MGDIYSQIANKLWPKERYPMLRLQVRRNVNVLPVLGFSLWQFFSKRKFGTTRWIQLDNGRLYVRSDDARSFWLAKTGGTQKEVVNTWKNLARLKPDLCIDAGSNYGEFTLAIAGLGIPAIAIDANPGIVNCLRTSFADYHNVSVVHAAVSDSVGSTSFYFNPQFSGVGSMSNKQSTTKVFLGQKKQIQSTEVKRIRLDSLVSDEFKMKPKSVILKIDVETFEMNVFKGAFPMLSQCDWWRVIAEFNAPALRYANKNVEEVWKTFSSFPGLVIGQQGVPEEKCRVLSHDLPESPPPSSCDILIGQGSAK